MLKNILPQLLLRPETLFDRYCAILGQHRPVLAGCCGSVLTMVNISSDEEDAAVVFQRRKRKPFKVIEPGVRVPEIPSADFVALVEKQYGPGNQKRKKKSR